MECLTGKQNKNSISKKSSWKASNKLQLIQANICGLIKPESNNNKRFILSFIDDFTRKTWIYLLHEKSEALAMLRNFKVCVEKETGAHIVSLRTSTGGKFTSNEFENICKD